LDRHKPPLKRRSVVYYCSAVYTRLQRRQNSYDGSGAVSRMAEDLAFLKDFTALVEGSAVAHMGRHLYGGRGAELWEKLAEEEPSYTVSRANRKIVSENLDDISRLVPSALTMIDLGPGGEKSVLASAAIAEALNVGRYRIKELSEHFLEAGWEIARRRLAPSIEVDGVLGDVFAGETGIDFPTIAYFGGGTIGNLEHVRDSEFPTGLLADNLRTSASYAPRGWLLLSFDTTHDVGKLRDMYGSPTNAKFIGNLTYRAAEEFPQLNLDPDGFRYDPDYIETSRQYAGLLTSTRRQDCALRRIDKDEQFHLVNSYKITPKWFEEAAESIGYSVAHHVLDEASQSALYLLRSAAAPSK
jgi:uncharacterized SAM-dependent methyltransferase